MIKIVGIEFIPRLGNGRPENGTGTFVETLMYPALSSAGWISAKGRTAARRNSPGVNEIWIGVCRQAGDIRDQIRLEITVLGLRGDGQQ
jgi:hypothetical protein